MCSDPAQHFKDGFCTDCPDAGTSLSVGFSILFAVLVILGAVYWLHEQDDPKYDRFAIPLRLLVHRAKSFSQSVGLIAKVKLAGTPKLIIHSGEPFRMCALSGRCAWQSHFVK